MKLRWARDVDWVLIGTTAALVVYGVVILISATHGAAEAAAFLRARVLHLLLGIAALVVMSTVDYRRLSSPWPVLYVATLLLLASVLVMGERVSSFKAAVRRRRRRS